MKTLKLTTLIFCLTFVFASCNKGGLFCYNGNGEIITETRTVSDFKNVELGMSGELFISQGSEFEVKIEASENLMAVIKTEVKNNTLVVDLKNNKCLRSNEMIKIYVSMPTIEGLAISGSGSIFGARKLDTDALELKISGSGDIELDSLKANELVSKISGSGTIAVGGMDTIPSYYGSISGSGSVEAYELPVKKGDFQISGSGDFRVNVLETMLVKISGSGDVQYKGNPTITTDISGSGNIFPY